MESNHDTRSDSLLSVALTLGQSLETIRNQYGGRKKPRSVCAKKGAFSGRVRRRLRTPANPKTRNTSQPAIKWPARSDHPEALYHHRRL